RIYALRGKQFAVVLVSFRPALCHLNGMFETPLVRVAERDNLETRHLHYVIEDLLRSRAGPDETERDPPVRTVGIVDRGPGAAAHPQRQARSGARHRAALDKLSAIDFVWHGFSPWKRHEWSLQDSLNL